MRWPQRGHALAQYALGQMYAAGTGTQVDRVKGYAWLAAAAAQGAAGAAEARDALLAHMDPGEIDDARSEAQRLLDAQPVGAR